jgi:BirA family biotin operon repressor/biotin-[acetyl-CoA-carboxylase] ligase
MFLLRMLTNTGPNRTLRHLARPHLILLVPKEMLVYTDSVDYARLVLGQTADRWSAPPSEPPHGLRRLIESAYGAREIHCSRVEEGTSWEHLILVEVAERSHYDLLIELSRAGAQVPDRVLCLAGSGERFHGFKGRFWSAPKGNTYLAAYLKPTQTVELPTAAFTVLAAVSVVDAIDAMPGLERSAGIKWVNDIKIDGAKVGGVLAYTQSSGGKISGAVLGIGVNVETQPDIEPTPSVPRATTLRASSSSPADCTQQGYFSALAAALDTNYSRLLAGDYEALLNRYRGRSLVIGREVTLCDENPGPDSQVLARGRVTEIGYGMELKIAGYDRPFTKGRLILGTDT